jgi:hypothetical protein
LFKLNPLLNNPTINSSKGEINKITITITEGSNRMVYQEWEATEISLKRTKDNKLSILLTMMMRMRQNMRVKLTKMNFQMMTAMLKTKQ